MSAAKPTGIVLHSYRRCPFAIRVRMTLEEKNLSYTVIEESLSSPSQELLRLHPEGKVPLLIHEGAVIYESSIITEYLDEIYPFPKLMPDHPKIRARLRLWTFWCNQIFKPDLDCFKYDWSKLADDEKNSLLGRLVRHLEELENSLKIQAFLLGEELSLADIHIFPFIRQLQRAKPEFSELARFSYLTSWLEKIMLRGSFERVMVKKS